MTVNSDLSQKLRELADTALPVTSDEVIERSRTMTGQSRRSRRLRVTAALAVGLVAAVTAILALRPSSESETLVADAPEQEEVTGIVAITQRDGVGARFCGLLFGTRPPSCSPGWRVGNLDWSRIAHTRDGDTNFTYARVRGTWDGKLLLLTASPEALAGGEELDSELPPSPCPSALPPNSSSALSQLDEDFADAAGFAGLWRDQTGRITIAFTDPAPYESRILDNYGGRVCVIRRQPPVTELERINQVLVDALPDTSPGAYSTSIDLAVGRVRLDVLFDTAELRAWLQSVVETEYVTVEPLLRPT
jgi:hypothetical protein